MNELYKIKVTFGSREVAAAEVDVETMVKDPERAAELLGKVVTDAIRYDWKAVKHNRLVEALQKTDERINKTEAAIVEATGNHQDRRAERLEKRLDRLMEQRKRYAQAERAARPAPPPMLPRRAETPAEAYARDNRRDPDDAIDETTAPH